MRGNALWIVVAALSATVGLGSFVGCKKESNGTTGPGGAKAAELLGPAGSPIKPTLDEGWCKGHGVPESVCTRCNASLIPKFKAAGDRCAEHGLPESQCGICHPEVTAEWAKLNPAATKPSDSKTSTGTERKFGPGSSPIEPTLDAGWCKGHGVPESVCTRCDASLIPKFKEAGDWCAAHGLPETQCVVCHPEVEAEWAKLNPNAN